MLKRDFILVQIEELTKVVLQIIMNRNTNAARHTPERSKPYTVPSNWTVPPL